jgi:hypothetical protein
VEKKSGQQQNNKKNMQISHGGIGLRAPVTKKRLDLDSTVISAEKPAATKSEYFKEFVKQMPYLSPRQP